jgi:integrase
MMAGFVSTFAAEIDAMLDYREARGYKRNHNIGKLIKFDRFCAEHFPEETTLSREIVLSWLDDETASCRSITTSATVMRQFGKYLSAADEDAYVLPDKYAANRTSFVPYIFTDSEMSALFSAIDTLAPDINEPYLSEAAPVLFRLTYTCGLRPNESRELLTENVNLDTGEILVTHTKQHKERFVVMSDDMLALAEEYHLRRSIYVGRSPYFFPATDGGAYKPDKILSAFNKAWTIAANSTGNMTPRRVRVYDLRHRFASACLNRWLDAGENLMVMLPYLRAYMGHASMNETAYYIHILPENLLKSSAINWDAFNEMFPDAEGVGM